MLKPTIELIGIDADDTLWPTYPRYWNMTDTIRTLIKDCTGTDFDLWKLIQKARQPRISDYGYGAREHTFAIIYTVTEILSGAPALGLVIKRVLELGDILYKEIPAPFYGVADTLQEIEKETGKKPVIYTKGDSWEQQSRIANVFPDSPYSATVFKHKDEDAFLNVLKYENTKPEEFVMIGDSLNSDILPVLRIGGYAIFLPEKGTKWEHETEAKEIPSEYRERLFVAKDFTEIPKILDKIGHWRIGE